MSKNILQSSTETSQFLDRLQSIHSVSVASKVARNKQGQENAKFQNVYEQGKVLGYAEGYASGEAKGIEAGIELGKLEAKSNFEKETSAELEQLKSELERVIQTAEQGIQNWYAESENRLSSLAVEIARKAVFQELETTPEIVLSIAKQTLKEIHGGTQVKLRINPTHINIFESAKTDFLNSVTHIQNLEIIPDDSVQTACIVESDGSIIDARTESYFDRLDEHIQEDAA